MKKTVIFFFVLTVIFSTNKKGKTTVSSVSVIPAATTGLSTGQYYAAGVQYEFRVQVNDPSDSDRTHYNYVDLAIPLGGATITARWTAPGAANGAGTFSFVSGNQGSADIAAAVVSTNVFGTSSLDLRFQITFAWNTGGVTGLATSTPSGRTVTATAVCDTPSTVAGNAVSTYGFVNRVKLFNFAQNGFAADGKINPYYTVADGNFNITGTLVYDIPGAGAGDAVDSFAGAVIGNIVLNEDTNNDGVVDTVTGYTDGGGTNAVSFTVPYTYFNARPLASLGPTYWRPTVILTEPDTSTNTYTGQNSLPININRILVTSLTITSGGGRDDGANNTHWRKRNFAGTTVTINAQVQTGGSMPGNTRFRVGAFTAPYGFGDMVPGSNFDIDIPAGGTSGSHVVAPAEAPDPGANATALYRYYVYDILDLSGNNYGDQAWGAADEIIDSGTYPSAYYTPQYVWWEDDLADPPDNANVPGPLTVSPPLDTASIQIYPTATSIRFEWNPCYVSYLSADGDFYEYRIYFKESSASTWTVWNGADDSLLRGYANNPDPNTVGALPSATYQYTSTGQKYTTIPNLKIFTDYDFYITAVDVFGNETVMAQQGPVKTTAYSTEASISDGITHYTHSQINTGSNPGDYASRIMRASNIRVDLTVITSEDNTPDSVKVWFTNNLTIDIVAGSNTINSGAFVSPNLLESVTATKTAPNIWTAHLPSTSQIIQQGNPVRFIVETSWSGVSSFSDVDVSDSTANDDEWSFFINTPVNFTPWPVRVLNNVITDKNPVAYPAYYLTEDANVTIKVYDIKGRVVVTLLDNAFRRSGQNIKENGWRGINKASKKLGPGLYYIHFRAKSSSRGKVILNKFKKVVIAR